jgi:hypothetical protein
MGAYKVAILILGILHGHRGAATIKISLGRALFCGLGDFNFSSHPYIKHAEAF